MHGNNCCTIAYTSCLFLATHKEKFFSQVWIGVSIPIWPNCHLVKISVQLSYGQMYPASFIRSARTIRWTQLLSCCAGHNYREQWEESAATWGFGLASSEGACKWTTLYGIRPSLMSWHARQAPTLYLTLTTHCWTLYSKDSHFESSVYERGDDGSSAYSFISSQSITTCYPYI